jgi:TldD protein
MQSQVANQFILKNGVLDVAATVKDEGINVRVVTKAGIGFASTNRLEKKEVRAIVAKALSLSRKSKRKTPIVFSAENSATVKWSVPQKISLEMGADQKIASLFEIERAIADTGAKVPGRFLSSLDKQTRKYVATSEGARIESDLPITSFFYYLTVLEGGETAQANRHFGFAGGWEGFSELDVLGDTAGEISTLQNVIREGKKMPPEKLDLVCGPEVVGIAAHESCGHPTEADRILGREASQAGKSFIGKQMLGDRIGSDLVTIIDDPTVKKTFGYYEYDDEGVAARPRYLYKEGRIHEFLHNRESAAKMGLSSNGSSRSTNYDREAIVRMANTFLAPGDWGEEEILREVKRGIYMKSFNEWNIDDKRYNQKYIGREAYLIENGELKGMVKNPALEITTPGFWGAVAAVGKKVERFAGMCGKGDPVQGMDVTMGGPMALLKNVSLR